MPACPGNGEFVKPANNSQKMPVLRFHDARNCALESGPNGRQMEVAHETAFGRLLPFRSGTKGGIKAAGRLSHIAEQCVAGRRLQANAERRPSPGRPPARRFGWA